MQTNGMCRRLASVHQLNRHASVGNWDGLTGICSEPQNCLKMCSSRANCSEDDLR